VVEELNHRREQRSQAEKQNPELEESPHFFSIASSNGCFSMIYPIAKRLPDKAVTEISL